MNKKKMGICPSSIVVAIRSSSSSINCANLPGPGKSFRNDSEDFPSPRKSLHCDRLVNYEIVTDYNPENNRITV